MALLTSPFAATSRAPAAAFDLLGDALPFSGATLHVEPYAAMPAGFDKIIGMTYRPDDSRMYVTTNQGTVFAIDELGSGEREATPWFDARAAVLAATGRSMNDVTSQRGLQSVAFHPEFGDASAPGYGKLYTTMLEDRPDNPGASEFKYLGNSTHSYVTADGVLAEWTYDFGAGGVATNSYRELFRVNMPNYDHPIKMASFNPHATPGDEDYGLLYMTHGDSNNQDSRNDDPQDRGDLMGKMIRINPLESGTDRYTIPPTNPFAESQDPDVLKEVYAYGFRNPHTFSFNPDDQGNTHILVGDIGRDNIEEVNLVQPGRNYGWTKREGTFVHHQHTEPHPDTGYYYGVDDLPADEATVGVDEYGERYTYPVAQWDHNGVNVELGADWWTGNAISSSFVIQNGSDPALDNQFIHLNFANNHGDVYHNDFDDILGAVTQLDPNDPSRDEPAELTQAENLRLRVSYDHDNDPETPPVLTESFHEVVGGGRNDARFAEGLLGEMYISSKENGVIYLVTNTVPLAGDYNQDLVVDAADFTVWRDAYGQQGYRLNADGNGDRVVDELDYDLWVANFGKTWSSPGSSASVPEPAGVALLGIVAVVGAVRRRSGRA
ncbi:PQQ-dependent sugar dehydrogenase [Pseudobythopirellula maris]|uniref:PQQ-dependent sugar dehydrogenase n=1 Tax=Pseudobythopirellula maris TaxID=2527991 RepID=UPI0018D3E8E3|nr:PQQ-dependent sugar dehydrogenase [Pseudobythopirellula maris]